MFSDRITSISPSGVREIFELVGGEAINLGLGEPDFQPPEEAREALKDALDMGMNKYGPTCGLVQLRESIASYNQKYCRSITPDNVVVTAGATEALLVISQSLFQQCDQVLIPEPGFVLYHPHVVLSGARPVPYGLREEEGFQPDVDEILELITPATKGIIVNSPSNPTGGVISEKTYKALVDISKDKGLWIISDEVYDNFIYEGRHHSFCDHLENSIVVNSFSKSLAVTGWRIGYLLANEEALTQLSKMHYYTVACPPTPIQHAVHRAMPTMERFLDQVIPVFDRRRRLMVDLLNEIPGLRCELPRGAFFAFPSYDLGMGSTELAKRIGREGVICSPGAAFGPGGEGHLRFSYATSEENIERGIAIIARLMRSVR